MERNENGWPVEGRTRSQGSAESGLAVHGEYSEDFTAPYQRRSAKISRIEGAVPQRERFRRFLRIVGLSANPSFQGAERREYFQKPLRVPRSLQAALPYKEKPKSETLVEGGNALKRVAIIPDEKEQQVGKVFNMIKTVHQEKQLKMRKEMEDRVRQHKRTMEAQELKRLVKQRQVKRHICKVLQQNEAKRMKMQQRGGSGGKRKLE